MTRCGNCDKTDGLCYTSNPPKVKCTITGEYHKYSDQCNVIHSENRRMANDIAELKPCPFCNGVNVSVKIDHTMINGHYYWYISHIRPPKECPLVNQFGFWHSSAKYTTKEKAIEAWNRMGGK